MGRGEIIDILNSEVFDNPKFAENLNSMYEIMVENNVQFFSLGGSFNRKLWQSLMFMMEEKSDLRKDRIPKYKISERFRDNIIQIADTIASKSKNMFLV